MEVDEVEVAAAVEAASQAAETVEAEREVL